MEQAEEQIVILVLKVHLEAVGLTEHTTSSISTITKS